MGHNTDGSVYHRINGKSVREHRLVYEKHYKCCLLPNAQIRHKNGIKSDNRINNLEVLSKRQRSENFGRLSQPIPPDRLCISCGSSKTRIEKDGRHHWHKRPGGYICDNCRDKERIKKKRLAYEQYYNCCLLPWTEIRQKNGIKSDIRLENLEVGTKGTFGRLARQIPSDRQCMNCGSFKTSIDKYGFEHWCKKPGGCICNNCHFKELRKNPEINEKIKAYVRKSKWRPEARKRRKQREKELRLDRQKALELEHDIDIANFLEKSGDPKPRQCAICNSTTTRKNSMGVPNWYKLGDLYQCSRCHSKQYHITYIQRPGVKDRNNKTRRQWRANIKALKKPVERKPKQCAECSSTTTRKNSMGYPNWYRSGGQYLCNRCYSRKRYRIKSERPGWTARRNETRRRWRARK